MEATNQTQTAQPTPEQLLKLLDLQLERERGKRAGKSRNRATFLVAGILFIIAIGGLALIVAEHMVVELRAGGSLEPVSGQMDAGR